jgi:conjugal transfer pilus assembly protein TraW
MKRTTAVVLFLAMTHALSCAEDLGIKGQVYEPDRDARDQMKDQIRAKQRSGELDKFWRNYRDKTVSAIKNPAPLGIKSSYGFKTEIRDLKFTFQKDVRDEKNNVVVRAGTTIEPLKIQPLVTGLIFIDGRDQRQVDYAIARGRREPLKIVLTAGSPFDLRVKYQDEIWRGSKTIPFYFDQRKMIINTLQRNYGVDVNTVPVMLSQRGTQLAVEYGIRP